jgi:hypothetical protein
MNVFSLEKRICERVQKCLDAHTNNELSEEMKQDVLRHLKTCKSCSEALQARLGLKASLKQAAQSEPVPAGLRYRIQAAVRESDLRERKKTSWARWTLAAAAVLVVLLGGWGTLQLWRLRYGNGLSSQAGLPQSISEQTAALLNIGVDDHVYCVVEHHDDREWSTSEQMAAEMGPDYFGLVALVNSKLKDYRVSVAHRCEVNGRRFVHVIFKNQERILSLVITQKGRDGFPVQDRIRGLDSSRVALHQAHLQGFEVVGFETKAHLAYVVSALDRQENLEIASDLAASVNDFLAQLEI